MPGWSSLNAVDAAERGAEIATRTDLLSARRDGEVWTADAVRRPQRLGADDRQRRRPWVAECSQPARAGQRRAGRG
jgi:glycerol-3-phosphate dehydrogenase